MRRPALLILCLLPLPAAAQQSRPDSTPSAAAYVPDLGPLLGPPPGEMARVVARFSEDREALLRRHRVESSPTRRAVLRDFAATWLSRVQALDFNALSQDARVDWLLLKHRLEYEQRLLAREERRMTELAALLPFAGVIVDLEESRRRMETIDPETSGRALARLAAVVDSLRQAVEAGARPDAPATAFRPTKIAAFRATAVVTDLRVTLQRWFRFYDGYHPLFSWWARHPYQRADSALQGYGKALREKVLGVRPGEDDPIVGLPIGRDAILEDLVREMIPYTPEELVAIAQRELAWCEAEMKRAARDLGLGDDWRAALERVKQQHVEPGQQPDLVRDLAREAEAFLEQHDLVTVPPLARAVWRMEMLTPEQQKESPFFLGGEVIQVSFPTESMSEDDKLMSMRGNNRHFARATVFHELIPGHHLQGFMSERHNSHRRAFRTPFWSEGNAFYWETLFWDLSFPRSPEDRVGMLFWRMHRAARIMFSLGFHLGTMTPQQAIDFLVERVGHERANATAEVRRSFNGDYSPLYQVAYMIGGLQFRSLHRQLVESGRMTNRQLHDAILQSGPMPVEMLRALLENQPLARDWRPSWKFAGERPR